MRPEHTGELGGHPNNSASYRCLTAEFAGSAGVRLQRVGGTVGEPEGALRGERQRGWEMHARAGRAGAFLVLSARTQTVQHCAALLLCSQLPCALHSAVSGAR